MTQQELKEHLYYDYNTGVFIWIKPTVGHIKKGSVAGNSNKVHKYIDIRLKNKKYKAHRLAWFYVYGEFPDNEIDHINHIKTDNMISNLRVVCRLENLRNKSISKNNTSGVNGVYWSKRSKKWIARIKINGKDNYIGCFSDIGDAKKARHEANKLHNFHVNHGC